MKKLLQRLLRKPLIRLANRLSSAPREKAVFTSLDQLKKEILEGKTSKGLVVPFEANTGRFIILSDQHKGGKDIADDFRLAEDTYITALNYYEKKQFTFINLGDCEELWESTPAVVIEKNLLTLNKEAAFLNRDRYYRIFGNHDLEWSYAIQEDKYLKPVFGKKLKILEGLILKTVYNGKEYSIFLTHGHQGDKRSDGNAFSKWVVAALWTPIQRYLDIMINTTSDDFQLVDRHNIIMYKWSATQHNLIFISGHTHKPVFASLDHMDRLNKQIQQASAEGNEAAVQQLILALEKRKLEYAGKQIVKTMAHPSYFNTGCCCFSDGDISGIEIEDGYIRLIKWDVSGKGVARVVLEESPLSYLFDQL